MCPARAQWRDIAALSSRQLARRVAYVPQSMATQFPFTALDKAVIGRTPYLAATTAPAAADRRIAMAQLERLGIGHLARRPFSLLSGSASWT